MPTYVYECAKCGEEVEAWQSFSDAPLKKHPGCGGKLTKVLQPVGIVFKGSGFHRTDSRNGSKRSRDGGTDKAEPGKTESGKTDSGSSKDPGSAKESASSKDASSNASGTASTNKPGKNASDKSP